jgi:hypothetical protein
VKLRARASRFVGKLTVANLVLEIIAFTSTFSPANPDPRSKFQTKNTEPEFPTKNLAFLLHSFLFRLGRGVGVSELGKNWRSPTGIANGDLVLEIRCFLSCAPILKAIS